MFFDICKSIIKFYLFIIKMNLENYTVMSYELFYKKILDKYIINIYKYLSKILFSIVHKT